MLFAAWPASAARSTVAILKSSSLGPFESATTAMVAELRRHPVQPEILTFDLEGEPKNAPGVLDEIHGARPALLIAVGSLATSVALKDPSSIPVIFSMVLYPRESGLAESRSHPVTGASLDIPIDVQLGYARRLLPKATRLGVLYSPAETRAIIEQARSIAPRHGFSLVVEEVSGEAETLVAIDRLLPKVDVLWTVADSKVMTPKASSALILAALRHRVPVLGLSGSHVRAGALAALTCDYVDIGKQTAEVALRVLSGESPGSIPFTVPRKVSLVLNTVSAKNLGLTISSSLEAEAKEVVR